MTSQLVGTVAAQGAAFLTRSLIRQLAARGWHISPTVEQLAVQAATRLVAAGLDQYTGDGAGHRRRHGPTGPVRNG